MLLSCVMMKKIAHSLGCTHGTDEIGCEVNEGADAARKRKMEKSLGKRQVA